MVEIKEAIHRDVTRKFLQKGQRPTTRSRSVQGSRTPSTKSGGSSNYLDSRSSL